MSGLRYMSDLRYYTKSTEVYTEHSLALPVYILGIYYHDKIPYVAFTDFTDAIDCHTHTLPEYNQYKPSSGVSIESRQVFYLSISDTRLEKFLISVRGTLEFGVVKDGESTNLDLMGLFALVSFVTKKDKNIEDSRYRCKCTYMNMGFNNDFRNICSRIDDSIIYEFAGRLHAQVQSSNIPRLNPYLVANYQDIFNNSRARIQVRSSSSPVISKRQKTNSDTTSPPVAKRRQINGAELLFHQLPDTQSNGTQTQVPEFSRPDAASPTLHLIELDSDGNIKQSDHRKESWSDFDFDSDVADDHGVLNINQSLLHERTTVKKLLEQDYLSQGHKKEKYYKIDVCVTGMMPIQPFIIKPYKRTVKLASFKLVLQDKTSDQKIYVEFNQEEEILKFLGITETEEVINKFETINKQIKQILEHSEERKEFKTISLTKSMYRFNNNSRFVYPYWTSATTLDELYPVQ